MQKWIGAGVLVVVAGGGLAWQQGWLSGTDEAASMAAYVPADTVMYIGGSADPDIMKLMRDMPLTGASQSDLEMLAQELARSGDNSPEGRFIRHLFSDLIANSTTYATLTDNYGFNLTAPQAIYMDGLVPVVRVGINDEAAFWAPLNEASDASGLQPRDEQLGDASVRTWRLNDDPDNPIDLAIRLEDGVATISFFVPGDDPAAKRVRMALDRPERSLADSGELDEIQKSYGFDDQLTAFIHLERLMRGIMEPGSNSLGQQLQKFLQINDAPSIEQRIDASCRSEVVSLAAQMPRIVSGNIKADAVNRFTNHTVIELKNGSVVENLGKLRGHIPTHTQDTENQILGLGLALNMDNLVPATTALWSQFTQADFSCQPLVEAQQQMASVSPAMMGLFTGMAQGTVGAGLSLYDLQLSPTRPMPEAYDFLVSVATSNPQPLLSLLASTPVGQMIQIPQDGSLGDVDLSFIIPGLSLKAGIKGNHIVAFSGEKAQQAVDRIGSESLDANGLSSLAVNYPRLADLVEQLPEQAFVEMDTESVSPCATRAQVSDMLRSQLGNVVYRSDISDQGLTANMDIEFNMEAAPALTPVGRFVVHDRTFDCEIGEPAGMEELLEDGTGHYTYGEGACDLYRSSYKWTLEGRTLKIDPTEAQSRDTCDQEWTPDEMPATQCRLIPSTDGFYCLFDDSNGTILMHYTPAE